MGVSWLRSTVNGTARGGKVIFKIGILADSYPVTVVMSTAQKIKDKFAGMDISEQDLLKDFSLSPSVIDSVNSRVNTQIVGKITQRLIKLSERNNVGMAYGMLTRPTTHGFLGYAVMSSETFGDAMRVMHKYLALTLSDLRSMMMLF